MKIITKKSVIFAALAVVLLATALIVSCEAPTLDRIFDKEEPSLPGTGKVRLTINNRNASRTIVPGLPGDIKYLLVLKGNGVGLNDFFATVVGDGSPKTVSNIPIGTYQSAQVIAYTGSTTLNNSNTSGTSFLSVAIGESNAQNSGGSGYNIDGLTPTDLGSHTPTLYTPGTISGNGAGTGTFSYNIINNASARLASAKFYVLGRGGTTDLNSGAAYTINPTTGYGSKVPVSTAVPTGYYNVIFELTDSETPPNTVYYYEILHVYKNLESIYTTTFIPSIFPAQIISSPGSVSISITGINGAPNVEGTLSTNDAANVIIAMGLASDVVRPVTIKAGTGRNLTFEIDSPSGATYVGWERVVAGSPPTITPITVGSNGVTVNNATADTFTITFDTTGGGGTFPYLIDGETVYGFQLHLQYDSQDFNLPLVNIIFQ